VIATVNVIPTITATTPAANCGAGTVRLAATASAGTINWYLAATGGSSIGTGATFTTPSLSTTTTYYVDATNIGCTSTTRTAVVATINSIPTTTISSDLGNNVSKGATVKLTAAGGSALTYKWSTANGIISGQNTAELTVRPSENTTYTVTVTNASGCQSQSQFTVTLKEDYILINLANIVTPNGDGVNDKLVIKNIDMYPNNELKVFDRAGRLLYSTRAYANDWDATVNGSPLAEGTYYYIVDFGSGNPKMKGFISVIRD
jgi:gliding motility-associated-like protein